MTKPLVENFRFHTGLWTYRLKDRSVGLAPGVEPLVIVGKDYRVSFRLNGVERDIIVPIGLATDFASVPRVFRFLVSRIGRYTEAALLHDFLYGFRVLRRGLFPYTGIWTRELADQLFLVAMKASNVSWIVRTMMYRAVRLGGAKSYRTGTNEYVDDLPIYNDGVDADYATDVLGG